MNKDKMKAKCEAWIKEGMGSCRAHVTYDDLNALLVRLSYVEQELDKMDKVFDEMVREVY